MLDDTKHRLLDAAGQVFADKGFEASSVREICQRAEANIAAVHYHFGDKRQLYVAAVRTAQCAQSDQLPFPDFPPHMPPEARLKGFIRTMFERMLAEDRPNWHLQLMLRELSFPTDACETIVHDYIRPMADTLRGILTDLLPPDVDEATHMRIGFSVVGQILFHYVHQPIIRLLVGPEAYEQMTVSVLTEHVTSFSLAALGRTAPLASPMESTVLEDLA